MSNATYDQDPIFKAIYPKIINLIQCPYSGDRPIDREYVNAVNSRKVSCSEAVKLLENTIEKIKNSVPLDLTGK